MGSHGTLPPGGPPPRSFPAQGPPGSKVPTERLCTLYVGKIPGGVNDEELLQLLQCCGSVVKWKRQVDPATGTPKAFGFCDFSTGESVLRAMRLLSSLPLDEGGGPVQLLLKVNADTQTFLTAYEPEMRAHLSWLRSSAQSAGATEITPSEEERDAQAQAKIDEVLAGRKQRIAPSAPEAPMDDESRNASMAGQLLALPPSEVAKPPSCPTPNPRLEPRPNPRPNLHQVATATLSMPPVAPALAATAEELTVERERARARAPGGMSAPESQKHA